MIIPTVSDFFFSPWVSSLNIPSCNLRSLFPGLLSRHRRVDYSSLAEGSIWRLLPCLPYIFFFCRLNNPSVFFPSPKAVSFRCLINLFAVQMVHFILELWCTKWAQYITQGITHTGNSNYCVCLAVSVAVYTSQYDAFSQQHDTADCNVHVLHRDLLFDKLLGNVCIHTYIWHWSFQRVFKFFGRKHVVYCLLT